MKTYRTRLLFSVFIALYVNYQKFCLKNFTQADFKTATELILQPRKETKYRNFLLEARKVWSESKDAIKGFYFFTRVNTARENFINTEKQFKDKEMVIKRVFTCYHRIRI